MCRAGRLPEARRSSCVSDFAVGKLGEVRVLFILQERAPIQSRAPTQQLLALSPQRRSALRASAGIVSVLQPVTMSSGFASGSGRRRSALPPGLMAKVTAPQLCPPNGSIRAWHLCLVHNGNGDFAARRRQTQAELLTQRRIEGRQAVSALSVTIGRSGRLARIPMEGQVVPPRQSRLVCDDATNMIS